MSVFTEAELAYLQTQRLARLATSSRTGQPDVSAVGFALDGDTIVSGGFDISQTVRHGHLLKNPQAAIVIDDLATVSPWRPRGVKIRGTATLEGSPGRQRIRISPEVIWSWGLNEGAETHFHGVERRVVKGP